MNKRESAICQPECFKMIIQSESVKTCLVLSFKLPFFRLPRDPILRLRISKREKNPSKSGKLKMLPSWYILPLNQVDVVFIIILSTLILIHA